MNYKILRKKHPRFVYESFRWSFKGSDFLMDFRFKLEPNIVFAPRVVVKKAQSVAKKIPKEIIDNLVFHIGLAEIPSYWKCAVSPKIIINAGNLNAAQINWWEKLFTKGLGEFFYKNGIDVGADFFKIISFGKNIKKPSHTHASINRKNQPLVLIGGGKDSLVAIEIFKKAGVEFGTLTLGYGALGYRKSSSNLIRSLELKPPVQVERTLDKKLFELNEKGYLNGHTPFSSYLAFLGVLCAELFGYGSVVVANERSANEPSLVVNGKAVNHQYSKSYEFEKDFRRYAKRHLNSKVEYFSIVRSLYEIQIAKLASKFPKQIIVIRSCNVGLKENSWCGKCSKCLNTFILLYPFLEEKYLIKLFKENLFEKKTMWRYIPALTIPEKSKPLECVGTRLENTVALKLAAEKCAKENIKMPYIVKRFNESIGAKMKISDKKISAVLNSWNKNNFLPARIEKVLKNLVNADGKTE